MARMTDQLTLEQHLLGYALNPLKKAEIEVFVKKNVNKESLAQRSGAHPLVNNEASNFDSVINQES